MVVAMSPNPTANPEILTTLNNDDLARLTEILPAAFDSIAAEDIVEFIPLAINAENADVLVSRNDLGRIASVMVVNVLYGAGKLRGRIDDVATHEDSRRQGHARAVLGFALEWFHTYDITRVNLTSNDDRQPAHALYRSFGFVTKETNQFQLDIE
jgi:ribosomal protein S18 acetylase RimI-like enzyme